MFQNLPTELLQYVFMLLSPCTDFPNLLHVCKRWRDVCLEVIEIRSKICRSAYRLQAPLKWCSVFSNTSERGCSTPHSSPSKRFGSMLASDGKSLYVFGGATHMQTTFNDLWIFDLQLLQWKRVLGEGAVPTPRAYAKGGFIDTTLYVFGGCQSFRQPGLDHPGRIECLSDLYSFDPSISLWSRLPLHNIHQFNSDPIPVCVGQSGCFLPEGPKGEHSLLILFGGVSNFQGTCTNDLCILVPSCSYWFSLTESEQNSVTMISSQWPPGRWGHSVCALDAYRMLVLFGNLQSPSSPSFEQRSPSANQVEHGETSSSYRGEPLGDMWILTRHGLPRGKDWSTTTWFWTKITCSTSVPSCPPVDFEHAVILSLPYNYCTKSYDSCTTEDLCVDDRNFLEYKPPTVFTIICVSQSTQQVLEEAARQRRTWQRQMTCSTDRPPSSSTEVSRYFTFGNDGLVKHVFNDLSDNSKSPDVELSTTPSSSLDQCNIQPPSSVGTSVGRKPGPNRPADKRAKQLEALAIQERRLFGSRGKPSIDGDAANHHSDDVDLCNDKHMTFPTHPLTIYSLEVKIQQAPTLDVTNQNECKNAFAVGHWLTPRQPKYLDLLFGPQECRGFVCALVHGCLFLFGGLSSFDEASSSEAPRQRYDQRPLDSTRLNYLSTRTSQLYVLQPRALSGTIV